MATITSREPKPKAVVFTYHANDRVDRAFIPALLSAGYTIALIVIARGPNTAMNTTAFEALGAQVTGLMNSYEYPVLCVKNMTQARPLIKSVNPSIGLCGGFPFAIPKDLLDLFPVINFHPAPLPELAGPLPFGWPIRRPDLYPIEKFRSTVHFMSADIDAGDILYEPGVELSKELAESGEWTAADVYDAACEAIFRFDVVQDVLRRVKAGDKGTKQRALPEGLKGWGARRETDKEKTVDTDMTVEQAKRVWRACFRSTPFFWLNGNIFTIVKMKVWDGSEEESKKVRAADGGVIRKGLESLVAFRDGVLKLELRKL